MNKEIHKRWMLFAIFVVVQAEFVWDLVTPNDLIDWVWYFIPIYLSIYVGSRLFSYLLAGLISALILAAFNWSSNGIDPEMALVNRYAGISTVWFMAVIISHFKQVELKYRLSEQDLLDKSASLQRLNEILHASRLVAASLNRETDASKLLSAVCEILIKTRGYVTVWIGQAKPETKIIIPVAHAGGNEDFLQHAQITWDDSSLGQGPTGTAFREHRAVVIDDIRQDPHFIPWRDAVAASGAASLASMPMMNGGKLYGVLTIKADHVSAFDDEELKLLTGLADDVARALRNLDEGAARRKAEENHARLAMAVEQSDEIIIITDVRGEIIYVNPAFEKSTAYPRAEALGKNMSLLKSGEHDGRFYRQMWETIVSGETWRGHFINRRKDGVLYEEEAIISPLRNEQGKIVNYVAVKRDVTHELKLESQYRQAQKMEAMGTLAGGIAHDFNNILTVIFGYSHMLQHAREKNQEGMGQVVGIIKAAERAKNLVQQILTFSRQSEQKREVIRLGSIVKEATKLLRASLPASIQVDVEISDAAPAVLADATQIYQVLMNLGTNALHAMDGRQGRLTVKLEAFTPDRAFIMAHPKLQPMTYACMTVVDTGHGMDAITLERIFEPFFTTKPVGKGTGLGLAVVHGIIESHEGVITVESKLGEGTAFRLYFPGRAQIESGSRPLAEAIPMGNGQKILVVDDEYIVTTMLEQLMKALNYKPTVCNRPANAIALVKTNPEEYSLVITDLTMPDINGLELARQLRVICPDLPIILMSGYTATVSAKDLRGAGIRELLEKPVDMLALARTLQQSLNN